MFVDRVLRMKALDRARKLLKAYELKKINTTRALFDDSLSLFRLSVLFI